MNTKYLFIGLLFYLHHQIDKLNAESITYLSTERPEIIWYDTKYFMNATMTSRRISRQDPRHYLEIKVHLLKPLDNNLKLDIYFYQFLTNRYRPSFVEMHLYFCDMVHSDQFFGIAVRQALGQDCPLPPGVYHWENVTIPYVPKGFPFTKGRIYCNATVTKGGVTKTIGQGSIDMEIKVAKIKKKN